MYNRIVYNTKIKYLKDKAILTSCNRAVFSEKLQRDSWQELQLTDNMNEWFNTWQYQFMSYQEKMKAFCLDFPIFSDIPLKLYSFDLLKSLKRVKLKGHLKIVRDDNLKRSKDKVYELSLNNDWEYFLTLTFNDEIVNASDIELIKKKLRNWLNNMNKRYNVQYLVMPEYHKDNKRVHLHALFTQSHIEYVSSGTYVMPNVKKPVKLKTLIKNGYTPDSEHVHEVFNVKNWKFGFSSAIKVYGDSGALSSYITKYLTKDDRKIFGKYYYSSNGLNKSPKVEYLNLNYDELRLRAFTGYEGYSEFKYDIIDLV